MVRSTHNLHAPPGGDIVVLLRWCHRTVRAAASGAATTGTAAALPLPCRCNACTRKLCVLCTYRYALHPLPLLLCTSTPHLLVLLLCCCAGTTVRAAATAAALPLILPCRCCKSRTLYCTPCPATRSTTRTDKYTKMSTTAGVVASVVARMCDICDTAARCRRGGSATQR